MGAGEVRSGRSGSDLRAGRRHSCVPSGRTGSSREGTGLVGSLTDSPVFPAQAFESGTGLWGAWSKLSYLFELHSPPRGQCSLRKQPCGVTFTDLAMNSDLLNLNTIS